MARVNLSNEQHVMIVRGHLHQDDGLLVIAITRKPIKGPAPAVLSFVGRLPPRVAAKIGAPRRKVIPRYPSEPRRALAGGTAGMHRLDKILPGNVRSVSCAGC